MANMLFANNCNTTLSSSLTNVATTMSVTSATGFPVPTGSQYFYCTLADAATQTTIEIVKVTAVSGTTFTIVRGQDGTTGTIFASGAVVSLRLVAASLNDFPKLDEANTFTGTITFSTPLLATNMVQSTTSTSGYLSNTDWTTFNGKQAALVSGTNIKTVSGTSLLGSGDLGTIGSTYGGTGQSTYAVGDLLQGGATNTLTKLAAVATGNALISGGVTTASSWGKIGLTTHISGTLAVGNGGTGLTSLTANYIPYGNGTGAFSSTSAFTYTSTGLGVGTSATSIIDGRVDQAATTYLTVQNRYHNTTFTQKAGLKLQLGDISESFKWCSIEATPTSAYESGAGLSFNTYNGTSPAQGMFINNVGGVQTLNTISVGNATPSTSGAGITFPATQSASTDVNTLDDYEEGTWTPTGNGITFAAGTVGKYTKIGNLVTLTFTVVFPTTANASNAYITAMPFTSSVNSASPLGNYSSNINLTVNTGNTYMLFLNTTGTAFIPNSTLSAQTIVGAICYQI